MYNKYMIIINICIINIWIIMIIIWNKIENKIIWNKIGNKIVIGIKWNKKMLIWNEKILRPIGFEPIPKV
uniref:Uncharacterized protein n=1 Tax=Rhizophora mucronata TaxID=61149 RepID=A0A2P2NDU4_RHIMU